MLRADPTRELLLQQIVAASTHEEIGAAVQAQLAWLKANPDDFGVLQAGEDLMYAFESLCLVLLGAMGYEPVPASDRPGEDSLIRRRAGPADERIAVHIIWTYVPADARTVQVLADTMRDLRASAGILIAGAGLTTEALRSAKALGVRVIDGDELECLLRTYAPEHGGRTDGSHDAEAVPPPLSPREPSGHAR